MGLSRMGFGTSRATLAPKGVAAWSAPAGLEAQWLFNNDATDNSGNSRDWTVNGTLTYDGSDKQLGSHSIVFDGNSANNLEIVDASAGWFDTLMGATTACTIEFWIKVPSMSEPSNQELFTKYTTGGPQGGPWIKFVRNDGAYGGIVMTAYNNDSDTNTSSIRTSTVTAGNWYHYACVRATDGTLTSYIGGSADTTELSGSPYADNDCSSTMDMHFGKRHNSSSNIFAGKLDCCRVWSVARSEAQIAANKDTEEPS